MDLSRYYEEICKEPMMSREEEFDAFMEYNDPGLSPEKRKKIGDRIIRANLRFVFKQAKLYSKNDPSLFPELISAGNEGLLVGLEKFKPSREVKFLSYAGWWVKQRILKEMSKMRIVSLPIWKQQLLARIQKVKDSKEEDMNIDELKKEFPDISEKDLKELHENKYLTYYLDDMTDDPSFEIDPIGTEVEVRLDREHIYSVISELPEIHRQILELSFGLIDGEEYNHETISKQLGISKDQLRQYKKEAFTTLRDRLKGSL